MVRRRKVVVIGAGHAGVEFAHALRRAGFDGDLTLIGDDEHVPYHRPPLSKKFLKEGGDPLPLKAPASYARAGIDLKLGTSASRIDRNTGQVELSDGSRMPFDRLVFATGARTRVIPIPGVSLPRVVTLRTLTDALLLRRLVPELKHVAILGGGFIGLEAASFFRAKGIDVTLFELGSRLMARSLSIPMSHYFGQLHRSAGTSVNLNASVEAIERCGNGLTLHAGAAGRLEVDALLLAPGVLPNQELAAGADLACSNGIMVDETLATQDERIDAIGDCASFPCRQTGSMLRLESIQNATDQARYLAGRLTGAGGAYRAVPWFWSNQYKARLQIAGLGIEHDKVVTCGDVETESFSYMLFCQDRLVAVESVNQPEDHMAARRLIKQGASLSPSNAVDERSNLRDFVIPTVAETVDESLVLQRRF